MPEYQLLSLPGPTTKPSTLLRWAATSICRNMITKGDTFWCSRCNSWYMVARFSASGSSTAAWVHLLISGMSQELRHASVLVDELSELSKFEANVCAFVCGSW